MKEKFYLPWYVVQIVLNNLSWRSFSGGKNRKDYLSLSGYNDWDCSWETDWDCRWETDDINEGTHLDLQMNIFSVAIFRLYLLAVAAAV